MSSPHEVSEIAKNLPMTKIFRSIQIDHERFYKNVVKFINSPITNMLIVDAFVPFREEKTKNFKFRNVKKPKKRSRF